MKHLAASVVFIAVMLAGLSAYPLEIIVGMPYGTHPIGHTAVRVRTYDKHEEVVYDFGRYGDTWGYLGMHGEGVMRIWRGKKAVRRYLQKQTSYRDSYGFTINLTKEEEKAVYRYYEEKIKKTIWTKRYRLHTRVRLATDYHGVVHQCTSVALEGLKKIWPRDRWEKLLDPQFNKGKGFSPREHDYYFKTQKKLGINEVLVPLDVLDALQNAVKNQRELIVRKQPYKMKRRRRARRR